MQTNIKFILLGFCITVFCSCNRPSEGSKKAGERINNIVSATVETAPTPQTSKDDSADDPGIWINPANPENSVIIGTDKKGFLVVQDGYNYEGRKLASQNFKIVPWNSV